MNRDKSIHLERDAREGAVSNKFRLVAIGAALELIQLARPLLYAAAVSDRMAHEILRDSAMGEGDRYSLVAFGRCVAIMGITPFPAHSSHLIWLTGTNRLDVALLKGMGRVIRPWFQIVARDYRVLWNMVPVLNPKDIRMLEWIGFQNLGVFENFSDRGYDCALMLYRRPE